MPLLADPDKAVAKLYGVTRPVLGTQRATFIIDADGHRRVVQGPRLGLDYVSVDELTEALASVPAAPVA